MILGLRGFLPDFWGVRMEDVLYVFLDGVGGLDSGEDSEEDCRGCTERRVRGFPLHYPLRE